MQAWEADKAGRTCCRDGPVAIDPTRTLLARLLVLISVIRREIRMGTDERFGHWALFRNLLY